MVAPGALDLLACNVYEVTNYPAELNTNG